MVCTHSNNKLLMVIETVYSLRYKLLKRGKRKQAIENRFGGNVATKKTHKSLLKQQYENFAATSTEILSKPMKGSKRLIIQLEMHGEVIPQEDIN
ncbi:hypothetical protein Tco_0398241 [Tanacetum coccineum]